MRMDVVASNVAAVDGSFILVLWQMGFVVRPMPLMSELCVLALSESSERGVCCEGGRELGGTSQCASFRL